MRKIVYFTHMTLNGRIANAEGTFWESFPWGETEMSYGNRAVFGGVDTWVLGRVTFEAIVLP